MTDNTIGKEKKDERTNNDLQNITHKTKDRVPRTPQKTGGDNISQNRLDYNVRHVCLMDNKD